MQCKAIIEKGLRAGQQCQNTWPISDVNDPAYGYCFKHAVAKGLIPKDRVDAANSNRIAAIVKAQGKRKTGEWGRKTADKREKVAEKEGAERLAEDKEKSERLQEKTKELLHKILGDLDFDAEELMADLKDGANNLAVTKDIQKFIFIGWHVADVGTRKPATLRGLCTALDMKMAEGMDWINSDWFVNDLTASMTRMMKLAMPYLQRKNLENALQNDFKAFQEYTRFFGKKTTGTEGKDWTEDMEPEIEEAVEGAAGEAN
jgi:hypothetical protein